MALVRFDLSANQRADRKPTWLQRLCYLAAFWPSLGCPQILKIFENYVLGFHSRETAFQICYPGWPDFWSKIKNYRDSEIRAKFLPIRRSQMCQGQYERSSMIQLNRVFKIVSANQRRPFGSGLFENSPKKISGLFTLPTSGVCSIW